MCEVNTLNLFNCCIRDAYDPIPSQSEHEIFSDLLKEIKKAPVKIRCRSKEDIELDESIQPSPSFYDLCRTFIEKGGTEKSLMKIFSERFQSEKISGDLLIKCLIKLFNDHQFDVNQLIKDCIAPDFYMNNSRALTPLITDNQKFLLSTLQNYSKLPELIEHIVRKENPSTDALANPSFATDRDQRRADFLAFLLKNNSGLSLKKWPRYSLNKAVVNNLKMKHHINDYQLYDYDSCRFYCCAWLNWIIS